MSEEIRDLLKKNHMSVTDSRLQILELFYHAPGALAHADIEKKASDKIDRVTIYHHHDNHVHFVCDECGKTICLDDVLVPDVKLPKGFEPHQSNMVVNGFCNECK